MAMKLKEMTIAEQVVTFEVEETGTFSAKVGEENVYGKTFEDVEAKATKLAKRIRDTEAVPVSILNLIPRAKGERNYGYDSSPFADGIGVVHAMLRGKHERGGDWLLAEGEKGKGAKFKVHGYRGVENIARRLTAEEVEQYTQLANAVAAAEANLEAFRQSVHVEPGEALGLEDGAKKRKG